MRENKMTNDSDKIDERDFVLNMSGYARRYFDSHGSIQRIYKKRNKLILD